MLTEIVDAITPMAQAAGMIVGIRHGTEEPAFELKSKVDVVEIRCYGPRIAAETVISADEESARTEGFRRLARYIFGANSTRSKIAMTAPVAAQRGEAIAMTAPVAAQRTASGDWVIRFFMPSKYTLETLPTPDSADVRLVSVPAESMAVLRYSGVASPDAVAARTRQLLDVLRRNGIETVGDPLAWFYDPPWTVPFRRRNEVAVAVERYQ